MVVHAGIALALWGAGGPPGPEARREAPVKIRVVGKGGKGASATTSTSKTTTKTKTKTTTKGTERRAAAGPVSRQAPGTGAVGVPGPAGSGEGTGGPEPSGSADDGGQGEGSADDGGAGDGGQGEGRADDSGADDGATAPAAREAPDVEGLRRTYALKVRKAIEDGSRYPPLARRRGWEGRVLVRLAIDDRGRILEPVLAGRSDHDLLDQAALASARDLAALPPPPGGPMEVLVPVEFRIRTE